MLDRFVVSATLVILALAAAACGATVQGAAPADAVARRASSFEGWSARNGTGAFFHAVGPAGGSGVRSGWPQ